MTTLNRDELHEIVQCLKFAEDSEQCQWNIASCSWTIERNRATKKRIEEMLLQVVTRSVDVLQKFTDSEILCMNAVLSFCLYGSTGYSRRISGSTRSAESKLSKAALIVLPPPPPPPTPERCTYTP